MGLLTKLEKITPAGRRQASGNFTAREWKEVFAARKRGYSWEQIWKATKRHNSAGGLGNEARKRLKDYHESGTRRRKSSARKPKAASGGIAVSGSAPKKAVVVKYKTVKRRHGRGRRKVKVRTVDAKRIVRERVNAQTPLAAASA